MSTKPETFDLTIRFPSEKAMMGFARWMCDGGGEQQYYESMENDHPGEVSCGMQYHAHDERYPANDKRRYGRFLADRLIIVKPAEKE